MPVPRDLTTSGCVLRRAHTGNFFEVVAFGAMVLADYRLFEVKDARDSRVAIEFAAISLVPAGPGGGSTSMLEEVPRR